MLDPVYAVPDEFGTVSKFARFRRVNRQNRANFGTVPKSSGTAGKRVLLYLIQEKQFPL